MKVLDIQGKLSIAEDLSHQEILEKYYAALKIAGLHFAGITKPLDEEVHTN